MQEASNQEPSGTQDTSAQLSLEVAFFLSLAWQRRGVVLDRQGGGEVGGLLGHFLSRLSPWQVMRPRNGIGQVQCDGRASEYKLSSGMITAHTHLALTHARSCRGH